MSLSRNIDLRLSCCAAESPNALLNAFRSQREKYFVEVQWLLRYVLVICNCNGWELFAERILPNELALGIVLWLTRLECNKGYELLTDFAIACCATICLMSQNAA